VFLTDYLSKHSQPSISAEVDYSAIVPIFDRSEDVPKHLFQICIRGDELDSDELIASFPSQLQDAVAQLRGLHPEWDYHLYCASEAEMFILDHYGPKVLNYYLRINPQYGAARADFLRYLLIYCFGGAYLDIKCGLSHSLDESIISGKFPIFFWDNMPGGNHHPAISKQIEEGEILQGFIVAPAGHPFLRAVILEVMRRIDNYNPYTDGVGYGGTMKITGPGMYTETIYNCMLNYANESYVAKPFAEYGFILNNVGTLWTAEENYQRKVKMNDYRKCTEPLVFSGCKVIDIINSMYLRLMVAKY